jgi:Cu/Ag efflux pump CusA
MLGAPAERLAAQRRVVAYGFTAVIGIYLLLQVAFSSWRLALLAMLMLPLSMVGGLVTTLATGGIISFGSILGFIAVLAIAARSCVLLVRRYQDLARPNGTTPLNDVGHYDGISEELVLEGTRQRSVPVLVSTVAILIAAGPFVVLGDIPGLEILRPMAIVILGGLVTSAVVTLYVLPALYLWLRVEPAPDIVTEPIPVEERVDPSTA